MKVVEIAGLGPGPFCAMVLADLGADVIRVDRAAGSALVGPSADFRTEVLHRGRQSVAVDLKHPDGRDLVLDLVEGADALIEGFRPGVAERLGIGPDVCLARNPRLIYGRMTGFGQDGPMSQVVGHDINYVAHSGVLSLLGREGQAPTAPLSLVGDFGGGGMLLALGILAAAWEARTSGRGQVIDAAMCDGSALLGAAFYGYWSTGAWSHERGTNIVDTGAPFYDAYETADGKFVAIAGMEQRFYDELVDVLGIDTADLPDRNDPATWPMTKKVFADAIRTRTREEWLGLAAGRESTLTPVLDPDEAIADEHNVARRSFVDVGGVVQPAPAPRFSRTPASVDRPPPVPGEHTREVLAAWGVEPTRITELERDGAIRQTEGEHV
ncbi:alpha-methylacyl-CoA racemase [Nocardioides sp. BE266]|nr:alpha-methylacyl-CoA racemase [Nocardioides sp. BE266]